jgi:hypothetical protein
VRFGIAFADPRSARMDEFRVAATSLHLRSAPTIEARRVAVLPHGHAVRRVQGRSNEAWWKVETTLQGSNVQGFVARAYLQEFAESSYQPRPTQFPVVHLRDDNPASARARTSGRAFPLSEPGAPHRDGSTGQERCAQLAEIIDWLSVDTSARYQPAEGATYCNVYAYDYCTLARVYLPRVWWTSRALVELHVGAEIPERYGDTVQEVSANALFDWLIEFGPAFGWQRCFDLDLLQIAANDGAVALACAKRVDLNRPGHVAMIAPETQTTRAARAGDRVVVPLQSQAGARTFRRANDTGVWWMHPRFRDHAFWVHP